MYFIQVSTWIISKYNISFSIAGQYSPAICLIIASYTGCNRVLTVFLLTLGVGLNGSIYSGFKINHLGKLFDRKNALRYRLNHWYFAALWTPHDVASENVIRAVHIMPEYPWLNLIFRWYWTLFLINSRHHATLCWYFDGIHQLHRKFGWFVSSNRCRRPHRWKCKFNL